MTLSNFFMNRHQEFRLAGKVRSVPDDAYRKALGEAIQYRQGDAWAPRPGPALAGAANGGK
ncbi:MAG: hypothetical protein MZV63_58855 [Marinilabiliales bacterium]|nr:hypothetical protein [Marinilabiliales bacterium]